MAGNRVLNLLVLLGVLGSSYGGAPVVTVDTYYVIPEEPPIEAELFNFTAVDPDAGHKVSVRGTSAITNQYFGFNITYVDGQINNIFVKVVAKHRLDREENSQLSLEFAVVDNIGNTVARKVDLYFSDINDNAPIFQHIPYRWEIPELPFNTTETYKITATDADDGDNAIITYALKANAQTESTIEEYERTFKIDTHTGVVTLLRNLSYADNSYYQFTVIAMDSIHNTTADFIVRVLDVQNLPPFFIGIPYRTSIDENIPIDSPVKKVTARDGDTGISNHVNYSIEADGCSSLFNISVTDGQIYTAGEIDRDAEPLTNGLCVLQILVQEIDTQNQQFGATNSTTDVTITVIDLNDNSPKFGNSTYSAEIHENAATIPISLIEPTDLTVADADDEVANTQMNLTLLNHDLSVCTDFEVVPSIVQKEGSVIIRAKTPNRLDFETVTQITMIVVATETHNSNHSDTATVTLNVLDMNDNNPQFLKEKYEFNVSEGTPNQTAGVVNATDDDSSDFGPVVYTLYGGNDRFKIDRQSGEVSTTCTDATECSKELNRETADVYYMTVTATDTNGTSGGRSNSVSLVVKLLDINDNPPVFTRISPVRLFIEENDDQYINTPLVKVEARDIDEQGNNNSVVWYNITSVSQGMFDNVTINDTTAEVFLTHAVNFEELTGSGDTRAIEVVVAAIDKGRPPLSSNITVLIEVQDLNDNIPQFTNSSFPGSVYENQTSTEDSSAVVGRVSATDADGSERNKAISYYIISGSSDRFRINSSSGEVSVQLGAKLDRDTVDAYNITIYAIDHGSPPGTGSTSILVEILDVNDELPYFNQPQYTVAVMENDTAALNTTFITCGAVDKDTDNNLRYNISDVKASNERGERIDVTSVQDYFRIDSSSGAVFVNTLTDRETAETIELTLLVEDLNAFEKLPQTDTAVLTITLLDINDNPPSFDGDNYTMSVSENALNKTRLESVIATDRDKNRTITYILQDGPIPTTSFKIENKSGTIIKDGYIDRETNATIDLIVMATDNGVPPLSSTMIVTIVIIDFNDNAPVFQNNVTNFVVLENSTVNTPVIQMNATDKDEGVNAKIKYSFNDPQLRQFAINETTGLITVNEVLDRETTARYVIQVIAKDQPTNDREQKTSIITITVNIKDVNDNAPRFDRPLYQASIREDAGEGTTVIILHASDADDGPNAEISYRFENDTDPVGLFSVDEFTGVVTVDRSIEDKAGSYVINVTAQDHGDPPSSSYTLLNITVNDVNLHKPVIVNMINLIKVYECAKPGFELYKFNYTDGDRGVNAEADFNISQIEDDTSVFLMHDNGSLTLRDKLNFTVKHEYQFQVQVIDRGIPKLSSDKMTVTVKVIDVNDHDPSFDTHNTTLRVAENKAVGAYVGTVTANDPDMDSLSCYTLKGPWSEYFTVGNTTGEIWTKAEFDRENRSLISFNITVKECFITSTIPDECGDYNTGDNVNKNVINETQVDVIIEDVDDNPPVFINDEIITGIRRTTEMGTILELKLKDKAYVTDLDSDIHGINAWKFGNNGSITVSSGLNILPESGATFCNDGKKHIFCIAENGSIVNNRYFSEDLSGYFLVPVKVYDAAGSDTAYVRIYLIGEDQVLKMVLFGAKETVSLKKDEILKLYSDITGHTFVYGSLTDHKTPDGFLDTLKTDLFFHVVDPQSQQILSATDAIRLIDRNAIALQEAVRKHSVIEIVPSLQSALEDDNKEKTIYILAALVATLAVTVIIIVYVAVTTRLRYQNKLKAATVSATESKVMTAENPLYVPGSNQYSKQHNPLLNSEVPLAADALYDNISLNSNNSLDVNDVGEIRDPKHSLYDTMEEREVTMDIFDENTGAKHPEESPLDAALRLHSLQSGSQRQKRESADGEADTGPDFVTVNDMDNAAFIGDLESTEI